MNDLRISNTCIRRDEAGRYCLNDLHRAAGGHPKHRPGEWLRNKQTQELVAEMGGADIPAGPVATVNDGLNNGTFAAKELVYAYGMWISAAFHLKVIRAYDAMQTSSASAPFNLRDPGQLAELALQLIRLSEELRDRVQAAEAIEAAHGRLARAQGSICISDAAKDLHLRPKDLFGWLNEHRWIYRRPHSSRWVAHQDRLAQGLLEQRATTISRSEGVDMVVEQVLVTSKGLARLAELLERAKAGTPAHQSISAS